MRESLNKMTVEVCKTQEGLYFLSCYPVLAILQRPAIFTGSISACPCEMMKAQVFDLGLCKLALVMSEIEFVLSESFQYQMGDLVMLFHCLCKDEDVIQVDTDHTSVMRFWKMSFIMV